MKKIIIIGAVVIVLGAAIWFFIRSEEKPQEKYQFAKVDLGDIESVVTSTGTLSAVTTVQVGAQVTGRIAKLYVDFNDKVKKGQLICELDKSVLQTQVYDAENTITRAQLQYDQSELDLKRIQYLFKQELKTQNDLDIAQYNFNVAKSNLKSTRSNLERAKLNLSYAEIFAPIDGTIIDRKVDLGQTVTSGFSTPTLFLIANDLSKMQILANVDEGDIGQIKEGIDARFTVQSYPDRKFRGKVSQIRLSPTTVQNVVNYTVVVNVGNEDGVLLPGMTATIDFILGAAKNVLRVPNAALRIKPTPEMRDMMMKDLEEQAKTNPLIAKRLEAMRQRLGTAATAGGTSSVPAGGLIAGGADGNGSNSHRPKDVGNLWYLDENGKMKMARVHIGITDGQLTEIKSGPVIKEGMEIIKTMAQPATAITATNVRPPMRMF